MNCPKCGRPCWGGYLVKREVRLASPPWTKTYRYLEYCHYRGSKKSITLAALGELVAQGPDLGDFETSEIFMKEAKARAGSEVVKHRVKA